MDKGKITGVQSFQVTKADGSIRKQWQENSLGKFIRKIGFDLQGLFFLGNYENSITHLNTITNTGLAGIASRINGDGSEATFTYLAVGTGTTASSATDTTLETEITDSGLIRASATCSRVTTTVTNDTAQLVYTWTVTGTKAVTEAGALNISSAGVLLGRQVFSAVNVANEDSLQLTYKFQIS